MKHELKPSLEATLPLSLGQGTNRSFYLMMLVALLVHVVGLVLAGLIPPRVVTDIPVRALSFKIGSVEMQPIDASPPPQTTSFASDPIAAEAWQALPQLPPPPAMIKHETAIRHVRAPLPPAPAPAKEKAPPLSSPLSQPQTLPAAAPPIADRVVQGDEKVSAADIFGDTPADPSLAAPVEAVTTVDVRGRYQQQIAAWLNRHKLYPAKAGGASGKSVVRMRVDRAGYVRYYALEESSGHEVLDKAAIDMVRRANPVPAAPAGYPAGSLIEFLVPIVFTAP